MMPARLEEHGLVENTCSMNTTSPRKGTRMSKALDRLTSLLPKTGLFAVLCGFLRVKGTGAPKIALRLVLAVLATMLGVLAFTVAPALAAAPETPETGEPTEVTATTATLNGVLNPGGAGELGTYEFLYKASQTECEGGSMAPEPPGMALGVKKEVVSVQLTGLKPGTEYTVCLVEQNAAGEEAQSTRVTFTTQGLGTTTVTSESLSTVEATRGTLNGVLTPNGTVEHQSIDEFRGLDTPARVQGRHEGVAVDAAMSPSNTLVDKASETEGKGGWDQ